MQNKNSAGNVVIIILVAVALFGALTFTLSKSMNGGSSDELTQARIDQHVSGLMTYASQAEGVVAQMMFDGTSIDDIDPILPSDGAFETGSDIYKLFHISGGGLNYKAAREPPFVFETAPTTQSAWVTSTVTNVEWTPTASNDLIITAFGIEQNICAELNERITGTTTIPALVGAGFADEAFAEDSGGSDLTTTECAACDGYAALCVSNAAVDRYYFYSIIGGQ